MTDAELIRFVESHEGIPYAACRQWYGHSQYEDIVAAARSGMIKAAIEHVPCSGNVGAFAFVAARRAAMEYIRRYSRTVRPTNYAKDYSDRCVSGNMPRFDDAETELLDSLFDDKSLSPAEAAEIADDIRHMIAGINNIIKIKTTGHNRRSRKRRYQHANA